MIHLAICDDERGETDYLAALVRGWSEAQKTDILIHTFPGAEAFLSFYEESGKVDILLLDIQMKGMDGVSLARRIRRDDEMLQIVFVTGYPDFVAEGYDVQALHYLVKPVGEKKLFEVLNRAARRLARGKTILITAEDGVMRVGLDDIESVETFDHSLELCTPRGRIAIKMPLYELEKQLTADFVRCHRCCVVNMRFVRKITRSEVVVDSGRALPLSRRLYADVNRSLLRYVKGGGEI